MGHVAAWTKDEIKLCMDVCTHTSVSVSVPSVVTLGMSLVLVDRSAILLFLNFRNNVVVRCVGDCLCIGRQCGPRGDDRVWPYSWKG